MKRFEKLILLAIAMIAAFSLVSFADATFSDNWVQSEDGSWKIKNAQNEDITDAWVCDDAVASNGKNVWYLLDKDGNMVSAGLVQDGTGNFYSLETDHNGYYGMLRYQPGTYDGIYLDLESDHNGSFAAIKNQDGIDKLKEKYGLKVVDIDNYNIVYTSEMKRSTFGNNGWIQYGNGDTYYYVNGKAASGWQTIGGKKYYFSPTSGVMYKSRFTPDGYYVNSEGVWDGKPAKTAEEQAALASNTEESEKMSKEDSGYIAPLVWDVSSKNNLLTYANKAASYMAEANALVAEAQKLADRKTAVKKYYNSFGKASGALEQLYYMKDVISERPSLKLANGSDAVTAINTAIRYIESFDTFEIEDDVDIKSSGFSVKIRKISDAAELVNQVLAAANKIEASADR